MLQKLLRQRSSVNAYSIRIRVCQPFGKTETLHPARKVKSYERKDILLYRAQQLLEECGWRYGLMMLKVRILVILYMYIYLIMYR